MQELTLTGGTLLDETAAKTSNSTSLQPDAVLVPPLGNSHGHTHSHEHHHHHNHGNNGDCCSNHPTMMQRPVLQLKKAASELVAEYNDEQLYGVVQQLVRMGTFGQLLEIINEWNQARPQHASIHNHHDPSGHTLLHWAAKRTDDTKFLEYFLQNGSHPATPTQDETKMNCLHWVCTTDNGLQSIKILLDHDATLLEIRDGTHCTPLLLAAQHGHVQSVAYLIQRQCDIHALDSSKDSATHWAAYKGSIHVLGLLSYYDTRPLKNPDSYGQTPLHLASLRGNLEVVRYILSHLKKVPNDLKEVLYMKDSNGRTPYDLAVHKQKGTVADVLQSAAWELNFRQNATLWGRLQHYLTIQNIRRLCTIKTCKIWLGLPEIDNVDESPRFPYYYVLTHFVLHVVFCFSIFVPIFATSTGVLWDYMVLHMLQLCLWIISFYCLYQCHTVNPGRLDHQYPGIAIWKKLYEQTLEKFATHPELVKNIQLCHTCHIARPPRSKHDRFTKGCVLLFDHHCPFVGTTVGLYNYKYFYMFVVSMSVYLFNFMILLGIYYVRVGHLTAAIVAGAVMGLHFFFPFGMWIYHSQLMYQNLTTNEHMNVSKYAYFFDHNRNFSNPWNRGPFQNCMDRFFPGDHCYLLPEDQHADMQKLLATSGSRRDSV